MTTYAAFTAAISGLTISNVTRAYTYAPDSLGTADLPASFIRLPQGRTNLPTLASQCDNTGAVRTCELVVCLEPLNQETSEQNMSDTIAMMDAVETALDTLTVMPLIEYTLRGDGVAVGGSVYWAVVAQVQGTE